MPGDNTHQGRFATAVATRRAGEGQGENPHLEAMLGIQPARKPAAEDDQADPLPLPDADYRAFSRRSNKPEFSIHFITPAGTMRSFQYGHLDDDSHYTAECLTLHFYHRRTWKVTIRGRSLHELYESIHQHRTAWVRVCSDAFGEEGEPLVSAVEIVEVKEERAADVVEIEDIA